MRLVAVVILLLVGAFVHKARSESGDVSRAGFDTGLPWMGSNHRAEPWQALLYH